MERFNVTSHPSDKYQPLVRGLFERAVSEGDTVLEARIRSDILIDKAYDIYKQDRTLDNPSLNEIYNQAHKMLESADQSSDTDSWISHYQTKLQKTLLEQLFFVPIAFDRKSNPRYSHIREQLVNGIYGEITSILTDALNAYDELAFSDNINQDATIEYQLSDLKGVINEMTMLAYINRDQDGNFIALPSSTDDDLYRKTDINLWHFTKQGAAKKTPIQVKSSLDLNQDYSSAIPDGGLLLTSSLAGNIVRFEGSRRLVGEVNATLSREELEQLSSDHAEFINHLKTYLEEDN